MMKIEILEPFGFCTGVELAMKKAKDLAKSGKKTCILGMLVHNNDAIKELTECGVLSLLNTKKSLLDLIDDVPKDYTVILTAHGHEKAIDEKLQKLGINYIDATCPKVLLAEIKIKESLKNNHEVIFVGKKNHPEANAMISISDKIHLYEIGKNFDFSQVNDISPVIISQTTFSKDEILNILEIIKSERPKSTFIDNICNASKSRQDAIKSISSNVDGIFVVGGNNSNNTKTLYELAKKEHQNARVFMIEGKQDLNKKDLYGLNNCVIASGASTPKKTILELESYLKTI